MLLTISDETSVKKLVNPRYQTVRLIRGDAWEPGGAAPSARADAGAREKIRAQSMLYMGVSLGAAGPERLPALSKASGAPDTQGRMAFGALVKSTS